MSRTTLSGHLVVASEALEGVRARLAELPGLDGTAATSPQAGEHSELVLGFATQPNAAGSLHAWLEAFEELLSDSMEAGDTQAALVVTHAIGSNDIAVGTYTWQVEGRSVHFGAHSTARLEFTSRWAVSEGERLQGFVRDCLATGEVFGLRAQGWARVELGGVDHLPFWSDPERARQAARDGWVEYAPKAIDLDAFLSQWLTGMDEDGILAAIDPEAPSLRGAVVSARELLEHFAAGAS